MYFVGLRGIKACPQHLFMPFCGKIFFKVNTRMFWRILKIFPTLDMLLNYEIATLSWRSPQLSHYSSVKFCRGDLFQNISELYLNVSHCCYSFCSDINIITTNVTIMTKPQRESIFGDHYYFCLVDLVFWLHTVSCDSTVYFSFPRRKEQVLDHLPNAICLVIIWLAFYNLLCQ